MTVSSINFQKRVYQNALKHDERKGKKEPSKLLKKEFRKENEFRKYFNVAERFSAVKKIFSKRKGKHPTFENSYLEAVVNLEEHHTLKDVEKLRKVISDTLGFQVSEIAIHRDEGHLESRNGKEFPVYNYHAHIGCFTLDENGKQLNRQPKAMHFKLQKLQTEVAEVLGMQRGKENSKATRLDHKQYREKAKAIQKHNQELERIEQKQKQAEALLSQVQPVLQKSVNEKEQLQADVKRLNNKVLTLKAQKAIVEAERKRWKDAHDFVAGEYRKLQALNKTLYTKDQLESELQKLRDEHARRLTELQTQNTDLKESSITAPKRSITNENTVKRTEVLDNTQSQPMSVLEPKTTEEKKYRIMFGDFECFMTAQDINGWIADYPEEEDAIKKQLSEADRAEVFKPSPAPIKSKGYHR